MECVNAPAGDPIHPSGEVTPLRSPHVCICQESNGAIGGARGIIPATLGTKAKTLRPAKLMGTDPFIGLD